MKDFGKKQSSPPATPRPAKRKKPRFFLKLVLGLVGLGALLIVILLSVNLNTFREPVAKAISQATGMKVSIEYLGWSFSGGLKIDCRGVQIFSADDEEELLSTKELLISLNWLPLLEKRVVVDSISLIGPVLKVALNPSASVEPLPTQTETSGPNVKSQTPAATDQPSAPDGLQTAREFLKNPDFTLTAIHLIDGRVIFQDKNTGKEITLDTDARMHIQRNANQMAVTLEDIKLGAGTLVAEGEIRTDDFLSENSPLKAQIRLNPFKVSDLLPVLDWSPNSRDAMVRKLKLKGDVHVLDLKLNTTVDSALDLDSFLSSADAALIVKGKEFSLVQYGKTLSASTLETEIELKEKQWTHNIVLGLLGGRIESQGQMVLGKGSKEAEDWNLDSNLVLEKINVQELKTQYFSKTAQFPESGIVSAQFHIQGPVLHPRLIRGKGSVRTRDLTLPMNGTVLSVAHMEGTGKWLGDRLNHQFHLKALGGEMTLEGNLKFKKDSHGQWDPNIDSIVTPKSIQLADLRPLVRQEGFPDQGTASGKVRIRGPVLRPRMLQADGSVGIMDTRVRYQQTEIPVTSIKGTGRWFNNQLAHDIKMQVFDGNVRIKGNLNLKMNPQGDLNPLINSDVTTQSIQLTRLQPLVQTTWFPKKGTLQASVHLSGPVLRPESLKSKGTLHFSDLEVRVNNTDLAIPAMAVSGTWANNRLTHDVKLNILDGTVRTKGKLLLKKNRQGIRDTIIDSKVFIQPVSLKLIKPIVAKPWFPHQGKLDGTFRVEGSVTRPQDMKVQGKLNLRNVATRVEDKTLVLSRVEAQGLWHNENLKHYIKARTLGGEVSLKGDLKIKRNQKGEWEPVIHSDVIPKSIQLSKLRTLTAKDWFPEKGEVTGTLRLKGPVKQFSQVTITGKLNGNKIRLKLQDKPVSIDSALLLFEPNAKKHHQIDFNLSNISIDDIELKKSTGHLVYSLKTLVLTQGTVWPKTGQVTLMGKYELENKDYTLQFTGNGLRFEDYKGELLEGPLEFNGKLFGKVLAKGFKKGMSGNMQVRSENGKLFKAGNTLTQIVNTLNLKLLKSAKKGMAIDFLGGDCVIKNGVLTTKNFRMVSPALQLWLNGNADLSEKQINAVATAIPLQRTGKILKKVDKEKDRIKNQIREVPIIGEIFGGSEDNKGLADGIIDSIPILGNKDKNDGQPRALLKFYFDINGSFDQPKVKFVPEGTLGFKKK